MEYAHEMAFSHFDKGICLENLESTFVFPFSQLPLHLYF